MKILHLGIIAFTFLTSLSMAYGDYFGPLATSYPENKTMQLYIDYQSPSPSLDNSLGQIHLMFFDSNTGKPIKNIAFMINATRGVSNVMNSQFYSYSGNLTLNLQKGNTSKWEVSPDHDPIFIGGYESKNDITNVLIKTPSVEPYYFDITPVIFNSDFPIHDSGIKFSTVLELVNDSKQVLMPFFIAQNKQPLEITQVELDSPFVILPDNQTCYDKPGFSNSYTCSTNIIPDKKIQCAYFIGSSTCEPIHQYTGGINRSCLDFNEPKAPQWFDMYNTQNKSISIVLFEVQTLHNMKPWAYQIAPVPITLRPHEGCTYGFGPVDEPLALDQTNMSFAVTYAYEGKNYTATTIPLTDQYNDSATWQLVGDQWIFAQQNTLKIPEFPFASLVLLISITSLIMLYRMKFRK